MPERKESFNVEWILQENENAHKLFSDLFFKSDQILWFDRVGYYSMSNDNVAKIVLATRGTKDLFVGVKVSIISPRVGVIDAKFFTFSDYFEPKLHNVTHYGVRITSRSIQMVNEPKDRTMLKDSIFKYILLFNRK